MQPSLWQPPHELSSNEQAIMKRIKRAKLFVFLRQHRHELFNEAFQQELATLYQARTRWQLVLDCLDVEEPPFSKGTLIAFRNRLIESEMDRRLIERTLEVARETGAFGAGPRLTALDSSPLWGAGRVEDTYNLLGHALRKALSVIARKPGRGLTEIAAEADASLLGSSSLKAALDRDWDEPSERAEALEVVLGVLTTGERWLETKPEGSEEPAVQRSLAAASQVKQQDIEISEAGAAVLREGVAKDRR